MIWVISPILFGADCHKSHSRVMNSGLGPFESLLQKVGFLCVCCAQALGADGPKAPQNTDIHHHISYSFVVGHVWLSMRGGGSSAEGGQDR